MRFLAVALLVIVASTLAIFSRQITANVFAHAPKYGQVVDVESGLPIADAYVIYSGTIDHGPGLFAGQSGEMQLYRRYVRTDADGRYTLPSSWGRSRFVMPLIDNKISWYITAFKLGYIVAGDEDSLMRNELGFSRYRPESIGNSPGYEIRFPYLSIDPIKLKKREISVDDAGIYYGEILRYTYGGLDDGVDLHNLAVERVRRFVQAKVCALDSSATLSMVQFGELFQFARDQDRAALTQKSLEPESWGKDGYSKLTVRASSVCKMLSE